MIIRIGPDVVGKVYFPTEKGEWELSPRRVKLPEGWYCISPTPANPEEPELKERNEDAVIGTTESNGG